MNRFFATTEWTRGPSSGIVNIMPLPTAIPGTVLRGVLVAAAGVLFAPTAVASCGDYVQIAATPDPTATPDAPPCQCQHGECHAGVPFVPPAEPTSPSGAAADDVNWTRTNLIVNAHSTGMPPDLTATPASQPHRIFHPPRVCPVVRRNPSVSCS